MNYIFCEKGHFYDPNQYQSCPYCAYLQHSGCMGKDDPASPSISLSDISVVPHREYVPENVKCKNGHTYDTKKFSSCPECARESFTKDMNKSTYGPRVIFGLPVVGWLVCVEGPNKGKAYVIHSQYNSIGRAWDMDIFIEGDHTITADRVATLAYDDTEKLFFFDWDNSKNIIRVNGNFVWGPTELHAYDELTIGRTKLVLVPLYGEQEKLPLQDARFQNLLGRIPTTEPQVILAAKCRNGHFYNPNLYKKCPKCPSPPSWSPCKICRFPLDYTSRHCDECEYNPCIPYAIDPHDTRCANGHSYGPNNLYECCPVCARTNLAPSRPRYVICENGHLYDTTHFQSCPECASLGPTPSLSRYVQCENGHFYDTNQCMECPECGLRGRASPQFSYIQCKNGHYFNPADYQSCPQCESVQQVQDDFSFDFTPLP